MRQRLLQQLRQAKLKQVDRLSIQLQNLVLKELRRFRKEASKNYPDKPNLANHKANLQNILSRNLLATRREIYLSARGSFAKNFGLILETKLDTEEQLRKRVQRWLRRSEFGDLADEIGDTSVDRIRVVIDSGMEEGLGQDDIAREIVSVVEYDDIDMRRARVIARTETHSASMEAERDSMEDAAFEMGLQLEKIWVSSNDPRTRPTHVDANGQRRPLDEPFEVGDSELAFPGDPDGPPEEVINCRCTLVYEPKA